MRRGQAERQPGRADRGVRPGNLAPQAAELRLPGCGSTGADALPNAGRSAALPVFFYFMDFWFFLFRFVRSLYLSIAKQLKVCMNPRASLPAGPSDARCIAL